jgi:hypothetical protein
MGKEELGMGFVVGLTRSSEAERTRSKIDATID